MLQLFSGNLGDNFTCITFYMHNGECVIHGTKESFPSKSIFCSIIDRFNPLCNCTTSHGNLFCTIIGGCPNTQQNLVLSAGSITNFTYHGHSNTFNNRLNRYLDGEFYQLRGITNNENGFEQNKIATFLSNKGKISQNYCDLTPC